jgi:hypothetical protein
MNLNELKFFKTVLKNCLYFNKMECQYCKNTFFNNSSLRNHQKKAKYCLEIQGKKVSEEFKCNFCGSIFTSKVGLNYHYNICRSSDIIVKLQQSENDRKRVQNENILLKKQLEDALQREKELMKAYEKLAAISANKSTTVTNNSTTNNNLNLGVFDKSADDIKRIVDEKYNRDYLIQGQLGVAKFTHKHVLDSDDKENPPTYLITDKNRGNGKYKISDTEVVSDPNMNGLTKRVHPSIKSKAIYITSTHPNPLSDEEMMSGYREVYEMDENNTIFRKGMIKLLD